MCLLSGDPVQGNASYTLTGMLRIIEGWLSSHASGSAQGKNRRCIGSKSPRASLTRGWHPIGQRPTRNRVNIPSHPPGVIGPIALHTSRFGNPVGSNKPIRRRAFLASLLHHFECIGDTKTYRPNSELVPGIQRCRVNCVLCGG